MENKSKKKNYKKRRTWTVDGVRKLLEVWKEYIPSLRRAKRNTHVMKDMSNKLEKMGVVAGPSEVKVKIADLTQKYRDEKKTQGPSGGAPSEWEFYEEVHEMLGSFKCHDFSLAQESIEFNVEYLIPEEACSSSMFVDESNQLQCASPSEIPGSSGSSSSLMSATPSEMSCRSRSSSRSESPTHSRNSRARKKESVEEKFLKEIQISNKLFEKKLKQTKAAEERIEEIEKHKLEIAERCLAIQTQLLIEIRRK